MSVQFGGLLALAVAAFAAPLAARLIPGRVVPPVVLEVLAGIAIGPQGLDLVQPTGGVYVLYLLGFGFLLFLAGQEIEVERFRGPTFRLTGASFVASLVLAIPVAFVLRSISHGADVRLLALAVTASSLGVMVPVLRDSGEIDTDFGQVVIMAGSVGEFGALLLLTVLFSAQPESTWVQVAYVAALGVAAILGAIGLRRMWQSPWLRRALLATDQSTSQLRVRGGFVILLAFAAIAHEFGVDALLGAFVGGVVLNIADSDDRPTQDRYRDKLFAIGFGFLVPVFFIVTGVRFDLRSLFASTSSLVLMPAVLAGHPDCPLPSGTDLPPQARHQACAGGRAAAGHDTDLPCRGRRGRPEPAPAHAGHLSGPGRCQPAVGPDLPGRGPGAAALGDSSALRQHSRQRGCLTR